MYHCLNFVTEPEGEPCAVLLRGLECAGDGDALARMRYGKPQDELNAYQRRQFLNGPGKVCQALGLTRAQNGLDLTGDELFLWTPANRRLIAIRTAHRDRLRPGGGGDFPWRFWI